MTDTYQAIYDAVRSRISGGNIAEAVADVARNSFDISHQIACVVGDFSMAAKYHAQAGRDASRPFILLRPRIFPDGNAWCALYGDNIQEGVCGFGDTPNAASIAFDIAWLNERAGKAP